MIISRGKRERIASSSPVLGSLHYARYPSIRGNGAMCAERTLAFGGSSSLNLERNRGAVPICIFRLKSSTEGMRTKSWT